MNVVKLGQRVLFIALFLSMVVGVWDAYQAKRWSFLIVLAVLTLIGTAGMTWLRRSN